MEWEDIPSFDPEWDVFSRFTHSTIKMQGYGLGFLIEVTDAAMCRESIQWGGSITLSIQYVIFSFLALSSNVHITDEKFGLFRWRITFLLCVLRHSIIVLKTCLLFRWSGSQISKISQSFFNAHILQARLGESTNPYPNSFFFILSCKVMNMVLNNIQPIL